MATIQQMMPYLETVKRLPGMQQELSLNDDQVIKLIDLQTAFLKQEVDLKADMIKEELKLKTLLQSDASAKDISEQLKSCAASHIDIGVAAYETANKMKTILNDTQKKEMNEVVAKPNPDYFDHMKNERGNIIKFCHHHYHHWGIGLTWIMGLIIIGLLVWLLVKVNKNCKPKEK
jgi:Spy/CpxP family protein refolding chaperone